MPRTTGSDRMSLPPRVCRTGGNLAAAVAGVKFPVRVQLAVDRMPARFPTRQSPLVPARRYGVHCRGWWYCAAPDGPLPDDLARLEVMHPGLTRPRSFQPMPLRRLVRAWSWLRLWRKLPDRVVDAIDQRFRTWMVFLAVPLLVLDVLRSPYIRVVRLARESWLWPRTAWRSDNR